MFFSLVEVVESVKSNEGKSQVFYFKVRITITEKHTGRERIHEGDLTSVINYLDQNSNFEQTISRPLYECVIR